jgi:hypothetical protein
MNRQDPSQELMKKRKQRNVENNNDKLSHAWPRDPQQKWMAKNRDIRVHIPTDAPGNIIGLKAKWQNVVKDIAYRILDLRIRHWHRHPQEQKDEIYRQVEAHFIYNPSPLQDGYIEKYLRDHLSSARRKWKEHWLMHGDSNRHPDCPLIVWPKMIQYWKSPEGIAESAQMKRTDPRYATLALVGGGHWVNGFILRCVVACS